MTGAPPAAGFGTERRQASLQRRRNRAGPYKRILTWTLRHTTSTSAS